MGGAGGRGASHRLIKTDGEAQAAHKGVTFCDGESTMRNMKGAWLWKGRLVNNRKTVPWTGSEETQKESGKLSERWLKRWPS